MKGTKLFAGLFAVALTIVLFATSCSKSTTNPNAAFVGTYDGHEVAGSYNYADTITVAAGSASNAVVLLAKTSIGTSYTFNGTVSGTVLTIPSQAFSYGANTDSISGTGILSSSQLTINYVIVTSNGSPSWNFTGTKQ